MKATRHSLAAGLSLAIVLQCGLTTIAPAQHLAPVSNHAPETSPARMESLEKQAPLIINEVSSGLAAYDDTALGNRMPLVLIHGIGGTESKLFHWENFLTFTRQQPSFNQRYKIYLYHYDSTRSVPTISRDLQKTLKGFVGALNNRNIKIVAYSEGGLLTRNAMQDKYLDDHTSAVLTIATPFHGSPLANPDWLGQEVKTEVPWNPVRMVKGLVYSIAGHMYPTFKQDFHWDNFDGAIPQDQYEKHNGPMANKVDYLLAHKKNFITYGSYFGLDVDSSTIVGELGLKKAPPQEKPMFSNLFKKNFLFSMIRNNIGKMPVAHKPADAATVADIHLRTQANIPTVGASTEADSLAEVHLADSVVENLSNSLKPATVMNITATRPAPELPARHSVLADPPEPGQTVPVSNPISMMMYNDGISPISSTLWLGRYTPMTTAGASQPVGQVWATLKTLRGNHNTRLFAGLDHRNFMDGTTRTGNLQVGDLLNPEEAPRTVFEWIVHDLMG